MFVIFSAEVTCFFNVLFWANISADQIKRVVYATGRAINILKLQLIMELVKMSDFRVLVIAKQIEKRDISFDDLFLVHCIIADIRPHSKREKGIFSPKIESVFPNLRLPKINNVP